MSALACAPALPPLNPTAPGIEQPSISFFGRSLAEYTRFFALDLATLKGRDVLDVAAGPSSFTAEACARKIDAVAVDPMYGATPEVLADRVAVDHTRRLAEMRAQRRRFRRGSFSSLEQAEPDRRSAAQRFLADYDTQVMYNRYVGGSLPRLPFFDGTFDLVLCAHLLFTYAQCFDFDWHVTACRELVRVSAGEVRLHPLVAPDGKTYAGLGRLRRELRTGGIASDLVAVDYKYFAGADSMLVLRRAKS